MADAPQEQKHIKAKEIPHTGKRQSKRRLWARLCYYYPQYTLKEASSLSYRDIRLLLKTAQIIESERMYNLVQIVAAPHTKKGKGVKDLQKHFKDGFEQ